MSKEKIIKKASEYASENWKIEDNPNEFDNCKDDFVNGALWGLKNTVLSSINNPTEFLTAFSLYVVNANEHEPIDDLIMNFQKHYISS